MAGFDHAPVCPGLCPVMDFSCCYSVGLRFYITVSQAGLEKIKPFTN